MEGDLAAPHGNAFLVENPGQAEATLAAEEAAARGTERAYRRGAAVGGPSSNMLLAGGTSSAKERERECVYIQHVPRIMVTVRISCFATFCIPCEKKSILV